MKSQVVNKILAKKGRQNTDNFRGRKKKDSTPCRFIFVYYTQAIRCALDNGFIELLLPSVYLILFLWHYSPKFCRSNKNGFCLYAFPGFYACIMMQDRNFCIKTVRAVGFTLFYPQKFVYLPATP